MHNSFCAFFLMKSWLHHVVVSFDVEHIIYFIFFKLLFVFYSSAPDCNKSICLFVHLFFFLSFLFKKHILNSLNPNGQFIDLFISIILIKRLFKTTTEKNLLFYFNNKFRLYTIVRIKHLVQMKSTPNVETLTNQKY